MSAVKSDVRKAAVVLQNLPRSMADKLIELLSPSQAAAVRRSAASAAELPRDQQQGVLRAFLDQASDVPASTPFAFLKQLDGESIAPFLVDERPRTIALVLAHLPRAAALQIVTQLPLDKQMQVLQGLVNPGSVDGKVVADVSRELEWQMAPLLRRTSQRSAGEMATDAAWHEPAAAKAG